MNMSKVHVERESVRYVTGETAVYDVRLPAPKVEIRPDALKFATIQLPDDLVFPDSVDLRPTVYDWNIARQYLQTPFDDKRGKLLIDATVQFNQLQALKVEFVPIEKQITKHVLSTWQPFAVAGWSTRNQAEIGAGLFYKKMGVQLKYQTDFERAGFAVGLMYLF
jgi:hypothetical protein